MTRKDPAGCMIGGGMIAARLHATRCQRIVAEVLYVGRSVITEVLGGELEFEFFHRWFNCLFIASACLTMLLFYGQRKANSYEPELPMHSSTWRD